MQRDQSRRTTHEYRHPGPRDPRAGGRRRPERAAPHRLGPAGQGLVPALPYRRRLQPLPRLAFQITFTLLPATIAVVCLATILHAAELRDILRQTVTRLAPGPAGDIVVAAFKQGERTVGGGARAALLFGVVATVVSAATAMGQVERGANRIYGVEQDRPTLHKYGIGVLLACTTGLLMVLAFVLIVAGADIAKATKLSGVAWEVLRWPLSILFLVIAVALLLKAAPKRRQPAASWLAVGSALSVLLWFAFTGLLALYLGLSK